MIIAFYDLYKLQYNDNKSLYLMQKLSVKIKHDISYLFCWTYGKMSALSTQQHG